MFTFLLIVQTVVAASLVGAILMQRSEGGGLGVGGSSSGFMTARGAADFLTRTTAVLGGLFIVLSIILAAIAGATSQPAKIDTSLAPSLPPASVPAPNAPLGTLGANQAAPAAPATQNQATPATRNESVPLAQ